jgi:AraC-like DNA-binding protein
MHTFKYLVANKRDLAWGLTVSTTGYEETLPGESYPSHGHADGYYFNTEKGRILNEYQMLYTADGEGTFQSEHCPLTEVRTGDVFFLFPGEWHSYKPSKLTGWKSYWIGFKGKNIDQRVRANFLSPEKPIYHVGYSSEIIHLYQSALSIAEQEPAFAQQILAGIVNHLIGMVYALERNIILNKDKQHVDAINKAREAIRENLEKNITIQDIAESLGISYSNFRKLFKEFAGVSPALYQQELRLQRAKELLSSSTISIKEIAYRLHFESADYFSTKFKKKTGFTPSDFRETFS